MSCSTINSTDVCPTVDELQRELLALLPPGRAWGGAGGPSPTSTLAKFWRAAAVVIQALEQRLCDLRNEFWCASIAETRPEWLNEYGLPDACDPYPDLCTKVAAVGGQRCEYFVAVAARAGWTIECRKDVQSRAGCMQAGCARPGYGDPQASLRIRVYLSRSSSYINHGTGPFQPGRSMAGQLLGCGPDISPLQCILARLLPAHLKILWETV